MEHALDTATLASDRDAAVRSPRFSSVFSRRNRPGRILSNLTRSGRAAQREIDERAELGYEVLAGRVPLATLRGPKAEPYLQGLDVLEARGLRLLEILAIRRGRAQRCPWRLSPQLMFTTRTPAAGPPKIQSSSPVEIRIFMGIV